MWNKYFFIIVTSAFFNSLPSSAEQNYNVNLEPKNQLIDFFEKKYKIKNDYHIFYSGKNYVTEKSVLRKMSATSITTNPDDARWDCQRALQTKPPMGTSK